jgi:hypothetical protein
MMHQLLTLDLATLADEYADIQLHQTRHIGARKALQYLWLQARDSERGFSQLSNCTTIHHSSMAVTLA